MARRVVLPLLQNIPVKFIDLRAFRNQGSRKQWKVAKTIPIDFNITLPPSNHILFHFSSAIARNFCM